MKGIILAGGSGSRLYPLTKVMSKQLLAVYDKPMIYYPLSVFMLGGIREILIISTPEDLPNFKKLLGDGSQIGISLSYAEQPKPEGLAQAFIIGEKFIDGDDVALILGDNIFYGHGLPELLQNAQKTLIEERKATVFGYNVSNPSRYGVAGFDANGNVTSIEEKPERPKSNFAVVGLYFYPNEVIEMAKKIKPSKRGELEITTVNQGFLESEKLKVELMGRGYAWLDTGTHESLLEAGQFVETIEKRAGLKIGCIEEIAYKNKYIDAAQLKKLAENIANTDYGRYLSSLL